MFEHEYVWLLISAVDGNGGFSGYHLYIDEIYGAGSAVTRVEGSLTWLHYEEVEVVEASDPLRQCACTLSHRFLR
jgi:hypothetical protein